MNEFMTWAILAEYASFVGMVFTFVEFTKEIKYIKALPTRYYSALVAFSLLIAVQVHGGTFAYWDIVLYSLSAIIISLGANGLSDFNKNKGV